MVSCSYSSKLSLDSYTVIDNAFFNEFLPQATGEDVKVYLYGLSLCNNPNVEDNNLDSISKVLSLTEEQVKQAFKYWEDIGLVQITSLEPFIVKYLPVKAHSGSNKLRDPSKYKDFNEHLNKVLVGRMITPTEFNAYYSLIETYHFEPDAIILIAKYCTQIKSTSVGYPYILAVARNFAAEGLKTYESVEQKFLEQEQSSAEIKRVLTALGIRRDADLEERNLYLKWINNYGFTQKVIIEVAKMYKKHCSFNKLDEVLTKYYEQKLFTVDEILTFSKMRDELYENAKEVCRIIGLYFQNYDSVVDNYISDWANKGYEKDALIFIANYCFKQSIRTLEGVNIIVQKFYKLGLISVESIRQYINEVIQNDEHIKNLLDTLGLVRSVSSHDREMYKIWTENWNFPDSQILIVTRHVAGLGYGIPYLNKLLSNINSKGLKTDAEISKFLSNFAGNSTNSGTAASNSQSSGMMTREYTKEELSALYDSLDDVEL